MTVGPHSGEGQSSVVDLQGSPKADSRIDLVNVENPDLYVRSELNGRYRLVEHVATGGMAHVFTAWDLKLDREVAIKIPLVHLTSQPHFIENFINEAKAAARLSHPHVVAVYDQDRSSYPEPVRQALQQHPSDHPLPADAPMIYLVMEYVKGRNLRHLLQSGQPLPTRQALGFFSAVASALAAAHQAGMLHRDIKPENVLVTDTGQVKVTDFGLAHAIGGGHSNGTSPTTIFGTAAYAAPEQITSGEVSPCTDVYAAGVMLFEMLTGKLPQPEPAAAGASDAFAQRATRQASVQVPAPSTLIPTIPAAVDAVVLAATHPDPTQRIPDGSHLLHRLRSAVNSLPAGGHTTGQGEDLQATQALPRVSTPDATQPATHRTMAMPVLGSPGSPAADYPPARDNPQHRWASPAQRRSWVAWALVAGIVTLATIIAGVVLVNLYGPLSTTETPALVGKTRAQAEQAATQAGLRTDFKQQFSETVSADQVISTDPVAGSTIDKDGTITVYISAGKERYDIPDLRGLTLTQAGQTLQQRTLKLGKQTDVFTADYAEGQIVVSSPAQGKQVKRGTTVDVTVSRGPGVVVPSLLNQQGTQAQQQLQGEGFQLGQVQYANSSTVVLGAVISQSPEPGTRVAPGSTVSLTISQGPTTVTVPDVNGWNYTDAENKLKELGLTTEITGLNLIGKVINVSPGANTQVPEGTKITLWVS